MLAAAKKKRASASSEVDLQLARYRSMRNFTQTGEPSGAHDKKSAKQNSSLPFVIQKHAATRLHYDFRLGWNGVLKSWAVTKGPSYLPGDKRLAVQVEDHPIEYGGFEGTILKGQYGGGTVMVWDHGTWEPHVDVEEGLRSGKLKFTLHGKKMRGMWALVRMHGKAAGESKPNWLLIKEHDKYEQPADARPITEKSPNSAITGRSLNAIARAEDHVWNSNHSEKKSVPTPLNSPKNFLAGIKTAKESLPDFIAPQLAQQTTTPPRAVGWLHELKLDGYRIQARLAHHDKNPVRLLTRTGLDWAHRMPTIADALKTLPVESALLDGEVVVLDKDGVSSFANLQAAFQKHEKFPLHYFLFDILHLNGHNLRDLPLETRKQILSGILNSAPQDDTIRLSEHLGSDAAILFNKACELGAEGILSKSASSKYISGRTSNWLKLKCYKEQEMVIGGYTLPSNGTRGVGALLLGFYRDGKLIYGGRTGTGFTQKTHRMLRDQLEKLHAAKSPFSDVPPIFRRGAHWVKPQLVAQISFSNWTSDNLMRQAAFKGLREDKPAKEVRRELPPTTTPRSASRKTNSIAAKQFPQKSAAQKKSNADSALPIRLTHPEKVLDPESGVTKQQLAKYYLAVSDRMLPHIANRPISLVRCPEGDNRPCFFQKHNNEMLPDQIGTIEVPDKKTGKPEPYITLSTPNALASLAQIGVLEIHPWGSLNKSLEKPDRIIFDLDPDPTIPWSALVAAALEVRNRLTKLGLKSFLKTTGGKGLHILVPIQPQKTWPEVKQFAHDFVLAMEKSHPELYLTKMTKSARAGKIYLDYLRNERGATSVAPYSPRARAGMPVSLPLSWTELKSKMPPRFLVSEFSKWNKRLATDPWKTLPTLHQKLP